MATRTPYQVVRGRGTPRPARHLRSQGAVCIVNQSRLSLWRGCGGRRVNAGYMQRWRLALAGIRLSRLGARRGRDRSRAGTGACRRRGRTGIRLEPSSDPARRRVAHGAPATSRSSGRPLPCAVMMTGDAVRVFDGETRSES
jgi:hypothetical protein